ncbi:hypothetical protein ACFWXA_13210 [Streptomyces atroolivaceus]|uniref:hypothetical protein n=1 Tax=Streptomyces atroolivaceus TaxID=66869 RepID=UPI003659D8B5
MDETPERPPQIPGVKYRRVKRKRLVTFEWRGQPKQRTQTYVEWVPVPPTNLDRLYVRVVIAIAVTLTLAAAVWSTTAIGRLLKGMVPGHEEIGYVGALAFEIPWVGCLLVQWILRDEPDRAKPVVIGGWLGLGVVVTAVVIDGYDLNMPLVGAVAAFISVCAKGFWWVVLWMVHRPLDEEHAGQLDAVRQSLAVERVWLREQSNMTAQELYLAQVYGQDPSARSLPGLAGAPELPPGPGHVPDLSGTVSGHGSAPVAPVAVPPALPVAPAPTPAVAPAAPAVPVAPPVVPTPSAPVTPPAHAGSSVPSVPPADEENDDQGDEQQTPVPPVAEITRPAIAAICREQIGKDVEVTDAALVAAVLAAGHPDSPKLADTVRRSAQRVDPTRKTRKVS